MTQDPRLPVTLLTGFLGSGKTTLLNHLLGQPGFAGAAVIVNEFGEVGLDHQLVTAVTENIVLLQSGCLCCAIRGDLIETLQDLFEKRVAGEIAPFERVVIETTGLADPVPVLQTLTADDVLASQFRLDGIIVTVDAVTGAETLDREEEAVRQAAVADRLVLTKTDIASRDAVRGLLARLGRINPGAPVLRARQGVVDAAALLDIGPFDVAAKGGDVAAWLGSEAPSEGRHDEDVRTGSLTLSTPVPRAVLDLWLDTLAGLVGPDLLRLKGIVAVEGAEGPLLIHGVRHLMHEPVQLDHWPEGERTTRIVVIARDMSAEVIESSLAFLRGTARGGGLSRLAG